MRRVFGARRGLFFKRSGGGSAPTPGDYLPRLSPMDGAPIVLISNAVDHTNPGIKSAPLPTAPYDSKTLSLIGGDLTMNSADAQIYIRANKILFGFDGLIDSSTHTNGSMILECWDFEIKNAEGTLDPDGTFSAEVRGDGEGTCTLIARIAINPFKLTTDVSGITVYEINYDRTLGIQRLLDSNWDNSAPPVTPVITLEGVSIGVDNADIAWSTQIYCQYKIEWGIEFGIYTSGSYDLGLNMYMEIDTDLGADVPLTGNTTYYYRITAKGTGGLFSSYENSFTTQPAIPEIWNYYVDNVDSSSADVHWFTLYISNGSISYGINSPYENGPVLGGMDVTEMFYHIDGLASGTTYLFELTASNGDGSASPINDSFTTS